MKSMVKATGKFQYQITRQGRELQLSIDQNLDGPFEVALTEIAGAEALHIDLTRVNGINSEGTRQFTKWLWEAHVNDPALAIKLKNVPPVVARQLVAMKSYIDEAVETESVFVPYFCDGCDIEDRSTLVRASEVRAAPDLREFRPAPPVCKTCGKAMDMDIVPDKYFSLLLRP